MKIYSKYILCLIIIFIFILVILLNKCKNEIIINKSNPKNIKDFLSKLKNKKIILVLNPGNGGDALIASGTLKVFDKLKLNYVIKSAIDNPIYNNSVLIYGGGGNLVDNYSDCRNFLKNNINRNNIIIILPHTIKGNNKLINKFDKNVFVCCREKISYNHVLKNIKFPNNVFLFDDMAFNLNDMQKKFANNKNKNIYKIGIFFRTDKESKNKKSLFYKNNVDLSKKYNYDYKMSNINKVNKATFDIFNEIDKYQEINTDRLHIAIAGSLLGKKTNLYQNNYYKNKAVYEYSIKNRFKNTILID